MTKKPIIRLDFCGFQGIDKNDNYFTQILSRAYDVRISDSPDLLIYSNVGHLHRLYTCRKLYWTGESLLPNFNECDYAMTCFYLDDPRHLRLPYYVMGSGCTPAELFKTPDEIDRVVSENRKFCSFVISNANRKRAGKRIEFFDRLSRYRQIDSGGRGLNNIGAPIPPGRQAKHDFLCRYKFNLCFENKGLEGYTTEKLVDAMWARTIPIYWGNPLVGKEFNTGSFLSLHEFPDEEAFIDRIMEVDRNEAEYRRILSEPCFIDDRINEYYNAERVLAFFERIVSDTSKPVSVRRRFWGGWCLAKRVRSA